HRRTERRASLLEGTTDDLETPPGLRRGVADTDRPAVRSDRCSARNGNDGSHPNGPGNADLGFIRTAARYELTHGPSRIWQTTLLVQRGGDSGCTPPEKEPRPTPCSGSWPECPP